MKKTGCAYGVGVGPGDPELMTLKAVRILREVDVIACSGNSLEECAAYRIAVKAVPEIMEKEIVSIPEENAFFIKGLGVPVMRWNYVIKMGKSLHIATEDELRHSIPYIVHQFKKVGAERMVEDGFNIAVEGVEQEEKPRLSEDEGAEHSFTYSETELYPGSAKGGVPNN